MTHGMSCGRLKSLEDRMNQHQLDKRDKKIVARRIVAAQLQGQINLVGNFAANFVNMGFWSRLRWLLFGVPGKKRNS